METLRLILRPRPPLVLLQFPLGRRNFASFPGNPPSGVFWRPMAGLKSSVFFQKNTVGDTRIDQIIQLLH